MLTKHEMEVFIKRAKEYPAGVTKRRWGFGVMDARCEPVHLKKEILLEYG